MGIAISNEKRLQSLTEFRRDAGKKVKFEKTGDMRVSFFSYQPGKCANKVSACTRLLSSIKCLHFIDSGAAVYFAEKAGRMTEKV